MERKSISTTSVHHPPQSLASRPLCECRPPTIALMRPQHRGLMATLAPAAQVIGAASPEAATLLLLIHNHLVQEAS